MVHLKNMSDPLECFDLYDPNEFRVIGQATRGECHGNPLLVHAVARVHVWNRQGLLLLQHRSPSKDVQPGKWDTSVGGHLLPGEKPDTAARREMLEELGVHPDALHFCHRFLWKSPLETEWVTTFSTLHDGPFTPDPHEITALRFWTPAEIAATLGSGQFTPAFEDEFSRIHPPMACDSGQSLFRMI